MSALTSTRTYALLAAGQASDAVITAIPVRTVARCLDDVGYPKQKRWILAAVKAASVAGLLSASRSPALARLTTLMLTVYFALAVGAHVRARDFGRNAAAAATLLAVYGAMTVKGPSVRSSDGSSSI
ncbi:MULTISPECIES: DoxX family protein [unclassified Mycobacterium]|uniref:DoxX family protein n=1 Tax=unclassified Mycobacterium TaxID=2642494 RepID=UPI0029C94A59|nr:MULTISPECIES: DoxX family protein [unclassified Mycobacterium]